MATTWSSNLFSLDFSQVYTLANIFPSFLPSKHWLRFITTAAMLAKKYLRALNSRPPFQFCNCLPSGCWQKLHRHNWARRCIQQHPLFCRSPAGLTSEIFPLEPWHKSPLLEKRSKVWSSVSKSQVCFFARSSKSFIIFQVSYSFPIVLHCPTEASAQLWLNLPSTASPTWMTNTQSLLHNHHQEPFPISKGHKGIFQIHQLQRSALNPFSGEIHAHRLTTVPYHQ